MISHIILLKTAFYKDVQLSTPADLNSPQNHIRKLLTFVREVFFVKKNGEKDIPRTTASVVFGSIHTED